MKIRIKGNSLRYRLTKSDIATLAKNNYLQEQTNFVGRTLIYAIQETTAEILSADFIGDTITLFLPKTMITELVETDKVGFGDKTGAVQLLVEKDFTCLDEVEEDQSDNYPNPLAGKI
jgi:hypothetical protein